jgi:hypothetical protein
MAKDRGGGGCTVECQMRTLRTAPQVNKLHGPVALQSERQGSSKC